MPARSQTFDPSPQAIAKITDCPVANVAANWPLIRNALHQEGLTGTAITIAALATVATETPFAPVNEHRPDAWFEEHYQGRYGNTDPGDGARYHGRGFIQLTFRDNYRQFGQELGIPLEQDPDLALDPKIAASILARYLKDHHASLPAARGEWELVRKRVNGGLNGWPRFHRLVIAFQELADQRPRRVGPSPAPTPTAGSSAGTITVGIRSESSYSGPEDTPGFLVSSSGQESHTLHVVLRQGNTTEASFESTAQGESTHRDSVGQTVVVTESASTNGRGTGRLHLAPGRRTGTVSIELWPACGEVNVVRHWRCKTDATNAGGDVQTDTADTTMTVVEYFTTYLQHVSSKLDELLSDLTMAAHGEPLVMSRDATFSDPRNPGGTYQVVVSVNLRDTSLTAGMPSFGAKPDVGEKPQPPEVADLGRVLIRTPVAEPGWHMSQKTYDLVVTDGYVGWAERHALTDTKPSEFTWRPISQVRDVTLTGLLTKTITISTLEGEVRKFEFINDLGARVVQAIRAQKDRIGSS